MADADLEFRARWWGGKLIPYTNQPVPLEEGEMVMVELTRQRSKASHRHQFAWVRDVWLTLPEDLAGMPWAASAETMRKHALIVTGYCEVKIIDCGSNAAAYRVKDAIIAAETRPRRPGERHGYALAQVRGPILTVWTPESQSQRAMGRERFQKSKSDIMDWIAGKLGVSVEEMARHIESGAAA